MFVLGSFEAFTAAAAARPSTVLVLQFHNRSQYTELNWVGESIADTLRNEFREAREIVPDRDIRDEGLRRLSLRADADFTIATLIRLGQTVSADYVCYGNYAIDLPPGESKLRNSSVRVTAMFLDLGKMHEGPEISEAGQLAELSKLEEHMAWQSLKYLMPGANFPLNRFMSPDKFIRMDAEESYTRGLLSQNLDQRRKWLAQALVLDPKFISPAFDLGKLDLSRNDYRQAIVWFEKIPPADPRYLEARFQMGLCAFGSGDYTSAANYFREVAKTYPLNAVYNDLGAAENELRLPAAIADLQRAAAGGHNDTAYMFNLGLALLQNNRFDAAAKQFQQVLDIDPTDSEAQKLLDRTQRRDSTVPTGKPAIRERLKKNFHDTAFRQLKAVLQSKRE
ncbi:MAG: tetratricopeptide repeat protein [Bryobacteraceae bacterium]